MKRKAYIFILSLALIIVSAIPALNPSSAVFAATEPIGYLDRAEGAGEGKVRVAGWAYDPDSPSASIDVHIYIGGAGGQFYKTKTDGFRSDVNNRFGITGNHGFDVTIPTGLSGTQTIYVYAIDDAGGNNPELGSKTANITQDTTLPVLSDIQIYDISSSGYTVSCTATDAGSGINRVQFPTWTNYEWQDDLASEWTTNTSIRGTRNGDTFTFRVKTSEHKNEVGKYYTDIYAWDNAGNYYSLRRYAIVPCEVHKNLAVRDAVDATCTKDGYTGETYCLDCDSLVEENRIIKASGHKWDAGKVTKAASYFSTGTKTFTCEICGGKKTSTIAKKNIAEVTPGKTKLTSASVKKGKLKLKWKRVARNTIGYQIGLKDKKTGMMKYINVKQSGKSTISKTVKKLDKGRKYAVKVRAYNIVEGKTVYGQWSNVKSGKVK